MLKSYSLHLRWESNKTVSFFLLKETNTSDDQNIMGDLRNPSDMDARVPKARKPYMITKQREKWTEEEHKLFLEAIQLHGRAWRRIQGTSSPSPPANKFHAMR